MTWMAPWALAGLIGLAAPILVHWLARQHAQRIRFPTVEFLMRSSPVSVRRHRLRDKRLMAVRMAIIAAAVLALAQPVWVRPGTPAARPARAIVLDTSASLGRRLADGRLGADAAREAATAASGQTGSSGGGASTDAPTVTIETDRPSEGVARAAAWLARQSTPRELIVVSDFQVGALVESDFDPVPEDAQVRLLPIAVSGPVPPLSGQTRGQLRVVVGREQNERATAAKIAAESVAAVGVAPPDAFAVSLVFPSADTRNQLWESSKSIDTPELFAWVSDIRRQLQELGQPNEVVTDWKVPNGGSGLAVFTEADPGSEQAAALMAAILRAAAPRVLPDAEREPDTIAQATLAGWQRDATAKSVPVVAGDRSDGRWFWLVALLLFGLETWMRRRRVSTGEVVHANAA